MSELNERIQEGLKGNYEGLNNGFKDLNEVLFGVQKKCYTLIGGLSGCLAKDTKVVMYDGSYKKVQDVKEGDLLMGPDSKPRKVLELYTGREQMYWIRQNKGQDYRVNESHILSLKERYGHNSSKTRITNISVKDYIEKSKKFKRRTYGWKPKIPIIYNKKTKLLSDPYLVGLWLADGRKDCAVISVNKSHIEIINYLDSNKKTNIQKNSFDIHIKEDLALLLKKDLQNLNMWKNKHVPTDLYYMSVEDRYRFIAGYLDGDGTLLQGNTPCFSIETSVENIRDGVVKICSSLGLSQSINKRERLDKRTNKIYKSYTAVIGGNIDLIPNILESKKCKTKRVKDFNISSFKIEKDIVDDYYGFNLDGDHLFLLEDFTVTHNTYKTTLLDYIFLNALEDAHRKNIKISVFYYSFEIDKLTKQCNWLSQMAFKKYNVIIPPKKIKGLGTNRLNSKEQKIIDSLIPVVEEMFSKINFIFDPVNPYGIFKEIFEYCLPKGEATYQEYKDENNQPKKRIASFKWYEDQYVLIGIDHLYLAKKEKNYTTKENMDKLSTNLVSLRNLFGVSPFVVQQFNQGLMKKYLYN